MRTVTVPIRIVSVMNGREHWSKRARRAKLHRDSTYLALKAARVPLMGPCIVTLTRIAPRTLDGDNLQSGCKAARDGVADWLDLDDASPLIVWQYAQRRGGPKEYGLQIDLTPGV